MPQALSPTYTLKRFISFILLPQFIWCLYITLSGLSICIAVHVHVHVHVHVCLFSNYQHEGVTSKDENKHWCLGTRQNFFCIYMYVHTFHFCKITWLDLGKNDLATTLWNCPSLNTLQNDSCYSISRAWGIKLSHKKAVIWPLKINARLDTFSAV